MLLARTLRHLSSYGGAAAAAVEAANRWQPWRCEQPPVDRPPRRHYSLQSTGTMKRFYDLATISEVPGSPVLPPPRHGCLHTRQLISCTTAWCLS